MSILVASKVSTDTFGSFGQLFFGESFQLESVCDHTVNMKFNAFYSTFTNVFYSCHFFTFFNVFYFNPNVFFYIYALAWTMGGAAASLAHANQLPLPRLQNAAGF